jgi:transmembrane protein 126A
MQTRAAFFQAGSAVAYPFLLAPAGAFMFATRHFTYRLPSITSQPKEVLKLYLKFTRSAGSTVGILLGINMLVAMFITSREMKEHANINFQLEEFDRKVESGSITEML